MNVYCWLCGCATGTVKMHRVCYFCTFFTPSRIICCDSFLQVSEDLDASHAERKERITLSWTATVL